MSERWDPLSSMSLTKDISTEDRPLLRPLGETSTLFSERRRTGTEGVLRRGARVGLVSVMDIVSMFGDDIGLDVKSQFKTS